MPKGHVGGLVEWIAAKGLRGLVGRAQHEKLLPFGAPLADGVVADVRSVKRVVRSHEQVVRCRENVLAPCGLYASALVQDYHRVGAAVVGVNVVLAVHADADDMVPLPTIGERRPARHMLVNVLAVAYSHWTTVVCHIAYVSLSLRRALPPRSACISETVRRAGRIISSASHTCSGKSGIAMQRDFGNHPSGVMPRCYDRMAFSSAFSFSSTPSPGRSVSLMLPFCGRMGSTKSSATRSAGPVNSSENSWGRTALVTVQ